MVSRVKLLQVLSLSQIVLGIVALFTGISSVNVTTYYNGTFGMGIWLGVWILLTGLAGMASAAKPGNYCRIGTFLGCCVVAIVILTICSILIGTVVLKHFQFESSVTRDYYKGKGVFGRENHEDYYKPDQYFVDRNKEGRVGLAVYSCLLVVIIVDVLLNAVSVYVCRDLASSNGQATNAGQNNRRTRSAASGRGHISSGTIPVAELGLTRQTWAELVFPGTPGTIQPIHLIQNSDFQFYTPYKLPNYAELYPDGLTNPTVAPNEQTLVTNVPDEPPPEYTPTADATSLPVFSSTESQERSEITEPALSQHTGASTPVLSLHPGDLEAPVSVGSTPSTSLDNNTTIVQISSLRPTSVITDVSMRGSQISEDSHSSGSLPNLVETDESEDLDGTLSVESQNRQSEAMNSERSSEVSETR
ncbi:uncharacterized protein [Porites lutea]|uniref:uncharacterized protein isoform X2 n=1 Tax=Porites lutea TaxID=51062 RepID=UPI003CC55D9E